MSSWFPEKGAFLAFFLLPHTIGPLQRAQLGPEPEDLMLMRGHAYLKRKHLLPGI
nr:hypothetical protein [uncultured Cohaesibacter sp.]